MTILCRSTFLACRIFHSSTVIVAMPSVLRSPISVPPASAVMFPVTVLPVAVPLAATEFSFMGHKRFRSARRNESGKHRITWLPAVIRKGHYDLPPAVFACGNVLVKVLSAHAFILTLLTLFFSCFKIFMYHFRLEPSDTSRQRFFLFAINQHHLCSSSSISLRPDSVHRSSTG